MPLQNRGVLTSQVLAPKALKGVDQGFESFSVLPGGVRIEWCASKSGVA